MTFNLNSKILFRREEFEIIGIDSYTLYNCFDNTILWNSFTIINDRKRVGISFTNKSLIYWQEDDYRKSNNLQLNLLLTGFCGITFQGDSGPSTPNAELIWFESARKKITLIEKFIEFGEKSNMIISSTTLFQTREIINENDVVIL